MNEQKKRDIEVFRYELWWGGLMLPNFSYFARVLRVIDGDTFLLDVDLGFHVHITEKIRLLGVNTPEKFGVKKESDEYKAGMAASQWVMDQFGVSFDPKGCPINTDVDVRILTSKDKQGKYGRYLATLYVGDDTESINTKLIHMGFGAEY